VHKQALFSAPAQEPGNNANFLSVLPPLPIPILSLLQVLADHLNAEIIVGTITSKQDAMDYVTWTYFFRTLIMNPRYMYVVGNLGMVEVTKTIPVWFEMVPFLTADIYSFQFECCSANSL